MSCPAWLMVAIQASNIIIICLIFSYGFFSELKFQVKPTATPVVCSLTWLYPILVRGSFKYGSTVRPTFEFRRRSYVALRLSTPRKYLLLFGTVYCTGP